MRSKRCIAKRTTYSTHGLPGAACPLDAKPGLKYCGMHLPRWLRSIELTGRQKLTERLMRLERAGDLADMLFPEIVRALRECFPERAEAMITELEQRLLP